jgi:hypothetical protein
MWSLLADHRLKLGDVLATLVIEHPQIVVEFNR